MRSNVRTLACGLAGALVAGTAGGSAGAPAPAGGLDFGRSVGRALVAFQNPQMCAIPLLLARCRTEFDAFTGGDDASFAHVPGLGPDPLARMRSYIATGDPASFPKGFATLRTATAPNALWSGDPSAAWAMDEGIADELVAASLGDASAVYATPPVSQMLRHARDGGPDEAVLGGEITNSGGKFPASELLRVAHGIDARHPAAALPFVPSDSGARGDVFLGIGFATLFQMCDAPSVAGLPESQAFLDRFFADPALAARAPGARRRLLADRDVLRFAHGLDRVALVKTLADLVDVQNLFDAPVLRRVLIGQFSSQIGYNAAVQRDPGFLSVATRHLSQWNDADAAFPGLARRRAALGLLDARDFAAQRRASLELLGFLTIDTATPQASAPASP